MILQWFKLFFATLHLHITAFGPSYSLQLVIYFNGSSYSLQIYNSWVKLFPATHHFQAILFFALHSHIQASARIYKCYFLNSTHLSTFVCIFVWLNSFLSVIHVTWPRIYDDLRDDLKYRCSSSYHSIFANAIMVSDLLKQ